MNSSVRFRNVCFQVLKASVRFGSPDAGQKRRLTPMTATIDPDPPSKVVQPSNADSDVETLVVFMKYEWKWNRCQRASEEIFHPPANE